MKNEECKRRIIEMVNLLCDSKLRKIYLILVVMTGGG